MAKRGNKKIHMYDASIDAPPKKDIGGDSTFEVFD